MRWKNTSTPTFSGSAGSAGKPSVVETMQLLDDAGNECAVFTKAVDGTLTLASPVATPAANDNDTSIATTAFVQGQGQGYLVYDATLTQTSTNAPVATVGQNNIGQTMTWARSNTGIYTVTAGAAAFTANKTQIFVGQNVTTAIVQIQGVRTSTTVITVQSVEEGTPADDFLTETAIRIVIFP